MLSLWHFNLKSGESGRAERNFLFVLHPCACLIGSIIGMRISARKTDANVVA